jgi:PIN domain nuclease of toxin-antitoxin system
VRILLDTNVFLWLIRNDSRLTSHQRRLFDGTANLFFVSVVTLWEVTIKASLGKLPLPGPAAQYLESKMRMLDAELLPIRLPHRTELERLPWIHRDPFDRLLVAQAKVERLQILSSDAVLAGYGVPLA